MPSPPGKPRWADAVALAAALILALGAALLAWAHTLPGEEHADPEIFLGWRAWLHLTIQWGHLTAFAFWLGATQGAWLLGVGRLDGLLLAAWPLLLVLLLTGSYNMEYSAGIAPTPSLLNLAEVSRAPFGVTYSVALAAKLGVYGLALLYTLVVSVLHLRGRIAATRLRRAYLAGASGLGLALVVLTAVVLLLHEAADLYPTALHPFGGRLGPEPPAAVGIPGGQVASEGFAILLQGPALAAIGLRGLHLLGFGLWLGLMALGLNVSQLPLGRLVAWAWAALGIQLLSGAGQLVTWVPFAVLPLPSNLEALRHFRFGVTYTHLFTAKLAVAGAILLATAGLTLLARRAALAPDRPSGRLPRALFALNLALGLLLAYLVVMLLLVHEGVDHAL